VFVFAKLKRRNRRRQNRSVSLNHRVVCVTNVSLRGFFVVRISQNNQQLSTFLDAQQTQREEYSKSTDRQARTKAEKRKKTGGSELRARAWAPTKKKKKKKKTHNTSKLVVLTEIKKKSITLARTNTRIQKRNEYVSRTVAETEEEEEEEEEERQRQRR